MAKKKKRVDELNCIAQQPHARRARMTWLHQTQSTQIVHGIGACVTCVCVYLHCLGRRTHARRETRPPVPHARVLSRQVAENGVLPCLQPGGGGGATAGIAAVGRPLAVLRPPPLLLAVRPRLLLSAACSRGDARGPPLGAPLGHVLLRDVHVHRARVVSLSLSLSRAACSALLCSCSRWGCQVWKCGGVWHVARPAFMGSREGAQPVGTATVWFLRPPGALTKPAASRSAPSDSDSASRSRRFPPDARRGPYLGSLSKRKWQSLRLGCDLCLRDAETDGHLSSPRVPRVANRGLRSQRADSS